MEKYRRFNIAIISILFLILFHIKSNAQYAKGCDIGWLTQMEASGRKFYDKNGVQKDLLDILKSYDINSIRLRVWVNPANGYCNKADVISQAVRCKNKGFRILIDFHYSDSWADPGQQTKPAAWTSYTFAQLKQAVATHTNDVLTGLRSAGVYPEWVQVGNETNNGMLWEDGRASANMSNFAQLVTSGYDAVKAVFPATKVIVHLSNGYDNALFRWMFDGLKNNSAKWDVIGMSLYPEQGDANQTWQTIDPQCLTNMNDMANRYGKEVILSEVGISWSDANAAYSFISDIMAKNKSVTGGKGIGIFYWEPQCYNGWQGYQKGAFDNTGKPTHAMDAFLEGATTPNQEPIVSITSPAANSVFSPTSTITIDVTASDPNGSISKVELYADGGIRIGSDANSPYSFTWTGASNGSYVLTAIAYDNSGQIKISSGITITIQTACVPPAAPTVTSPIAYCQGAAPTALTANGSALKWYADATTTTSSTTAPTTSSSTPGTKNYYVSQTVNGCESSRATLAVTVNALPSAPTVTSPIAYCQGAATAALTANGSALKWYADATTTTSSTTAPIPASSAAGTKNYYVSQTVNGCESSRTTIAVTVNALPSAPTVTSPLTYCQGAATAALTANGSALKWYADATTTTSSTTAPIPASSTAGTKNYYVSQTVNGCESSRATLAVTVNALPSAPTVTSPLTYCQGAATAALTANGSALKWYADATTTTSSTTAPIPVSSAAGTKNYYVSQTVNGCESSRATLAVTVNALPSAPIVTSPLTYCQGAATAALTANGSALKWYADATTTTSSTTAPIPASSTAGTKNYYVSQTVNGCESSRATLTVNIHAAPSSSIAGNDQYISSSSATLAANTPATGTGTWTVILGTGIFSNNHNPAATVSGLSQGKNSFQWTISNGSCADRSSEVSIFVGTAPVSQTISGPDSIGFGTTVSFSIQAHVGSSYNWTVPSGATIQSGQNSNTIQVLFGNTVTTGIIHVTETNSYGSATSEKDIVSGPAPSISTLTGPSEVNTGTNTYTFSVPLIPYTRYNWSIPQGAMIQSGQGSNVITVTFPAGTNNGQVEVTATNAFGSSSNSMPVSIFTTTGTISYANNTTVTIAPNPFVNETSILFGSSNTKGNVLLKILNLEGNIVYESPEYSTDEVISIGRDLKNGVYIVIIIYENESRVLKIIKNE